MTQAPTMPLHMRRDRFAPVDELRELREGEGVRRFETPFGATMWIVTRYADVREVLGDADPVQQPLAFRPPADPRSEEEREQARAGQLLALDPPEHTRLRRMLTPEFTVRRMRRLEPRIVEIVDEHLDAMEAAGPPADLVADVRAADPVAGDLRAARRALRRPRGVPGTAPPASSTSRCRWRSGCALARARAGPTWPALVARAQARAGRGHARHAGPRARRRAHRRRAGRHRRPAAHRRARDDVQHARAGHARAAAPPRPARPGARRPGGRRRPPSRSCCAG